MKTRLITLTYRGSASVDPRYSAAMLPWTINDIRSMENYTRLSVGVENGTLESYNSDFELQFGHPLKHVVGMCRIIHRNGRTGYSQVKQNTNGIKNALSNATVLSSSSSLSSMSSSSSTCNSNGTSSSVSAGSAGTGNSNACDSNGSAAVKSAAIMEFNGPLTGLVYLIKDPRDPLLHIHLFECESIDEMAELMHQMRDPAHTLGGSVGSIPQTLVANSGSGSDQSLQKALGNGLHSTPATNLKLSEAVRNAPHDASPNLVSSKMTSSKSYTHGLSNSAGTVHIPTSTSAQANLSLLGDISPNHTHFFEVMYVGKIRVSHKRVPFTFIDDALPKFKAYDAQRSRLVQMGTNRKMSLNSAEGSFEVTKEETTSTGNSEVDSEEASDEGSIKSDGNELKNVEIESEVLEDNKIKTEEDNKENKSPKRLTRGHSQLVLPVKRENNGGEVDGGGVIVVNKPPTPPLTAPVLPEQYSALENIPKQRDRSASYGCIPPYVEQNRTMVFLVGRSDLRLISPDRKQVLLYKDFKDVASCAQGNTHADHFGIICREGHNDGYIGYVFKCQSDHVCDDIVAAISQAFITCSEQKKKEASQVFSCEHCPMLWYHKLCSDVEGLSEKKTQNVIFRRIESLSDDEQDTIWAKYYGSEKTSSSLGEQNQFLMMLLRAHCESRQQRHVHDTAENRSEFLNQYLGGSTIFMKAKRSLTSSFDHLLKRKASKDDINIPHNVRDFHIKESKEEPSESPPEGFRSRSNTLGSISPNKPNAEQLKSPMMDIFRKVGNNPKESSTHQGSWRQAILNSVVTPSKANEGDPQAEFLSPMRVIQQKSGKRTKEELRELWRTAIRQTILLNRMENENAMLQARQNENEIKKIKLDYEEILPCDKQLIERWEMIIERDSVKITNKKDPRVLMQAIKTGVPRSKRGDVWTFLAEQHSMNTAPVDTKKFPNFNTPYHTLLKNLTEHQHAIFIDLGRTFPNHKYYKDPLGVGQLSLFNLLKAYSILDPELGYCQGLGFICGVLLLHCDEADAFQLLKHLMFRRQMRTKYLPDMKKFQLQLYQLSRLVKDHMPDLYEWLDKNDVSPTLYAAPWILTVFSSQFPLGFVARVFDLLFLESPEVIFKFAVSLLSVHKDELLARDGFEEIMDYLKNVVPKMTSDTMEQIMRMIFTMDISKQLTEYKVEYNVLQEEITTTKHHLEMLNREKAQSQHLETQLQFAQSSIAQLEKTRASQQTQITTLQSQVQTLELTIQTLGRFVGHIVERDVDLELPSDVRRILQQLDDIEKQRRRPYFSDRKINKSISVNSHLGFPLKVLEELNEREEGSSPVKKKTPFFENTYEHLRQQRAGGGPSTQNINQQQQQQQQRPNRLIDSNTITEGHSRYDELKLPTHVDRVVSNLKSPIEVDSGVGTPISPPPSISISNSSGQKSPLINRQDVGLKIEEMHPLSMVGDVNVRFNGTTQLKSFRPVHHSKTISSMTSPQTNGSSTRTAEPGAASQS
ncbi:TBC1 domain family member 4 isoform X2 [Episyrphus balteatus]|uniref:TBC1 domain family member 4 isoform X2 n=1 Tax=Episyrphus balteatus TaxID=286459 RepID=UPI0024859E9C|nr:TBC1 domain family member 4 isoform X2 [Episyrphus balteatus]